MVLGCISTWLLFSYVFESFKENVYCLNRTPQGKVCVVGTRSGDEALGSRVLGAVSAGAPSTPVLTRVGGASGGDPLSVGVRLWL